MALRKKKSVNHLAEAADKEKQEIIQALQTLKPQTKMGRRLVALSLQGIQAGIEPMSTEEILESLGRHKNYENLH